MTTPTNKKSKAATRARRANHDKITLQKALICDNCSGDRLPHRVCPSCGYYNKRLAVTVKTQVKAEAPVAE